MFRRGKCIPYTSILNVYLTGYNYLCFILTLWLRLGCGLEHTVLVQYTPRVTPYIYIEYIIDRYPSVLTRSHCEGARRVDVLPAARTDDGRIVGLAGPKPVAHYISI